MKRFEMVFQNSIAYLKQHGIMTMIFIEESDPRNSSKYRDDIPMRCLSYMIRLENIEVVRVSTLQQIQITAQQY